MTMVGTTETAAVDRLAAAPLLAGQPWASYATRDDDPQATSRRYPEPLALHAHPFQRDRERLTRSAAFRRLSAKTQVFAGELGDYHRTRLTHTLEVASLARGLGRALRLNEDLVEAQALAHDLGHPPFGHAGEAVLNRCLAPVGGFCHNRHALVVLEELETCQGAFPGLNLTTAVLAGQRTRSRLSAEGVRGEAAAPLLETQVVEAADSIAYDTHDADDALELGLLRLDELLEQPLWREAAARVRGQFAALDALSLRRAVLCELSTWQCADLVEQSQARLRDYLASGAAARTRPWLVAGSDELAQAKRELERFLYQRVYRHPDVLATRLRVETQLEGLFHTCLEQPQRLTPKFQQRAGQVGLPRAVGEYLAGMTDRYAQHLARRWSLEGHSP